MRIEGGRRSNIYRIRVYIHNLDGHNRQSWPVQQNQKVLGLVAKVRRLDSIVIHCTATPPSMDIGVEEVRQWHTSEPRNWSDVGYHYIIKRNGAVDIGRDIEIAGAHAVGHNLTSIGVALVGGVDEDNQPQMNFTPNQMDVLRHTVDSLRHAYGELAVIGHRDLPGVNKACPCFDVHDWYYEDKQCSE